MLGRILLGLLAAATLYLCAIGPANAAVDPAKRTHQLDAATLSLQRQVFVAYPPPHREPRCYTDGCRWSHAILAAQRFAKWQRIRAYYAHPSIASCWVLVARAFRYWPASSIVRKIISRESGCYWRAANPTSSARGVAQFMSSWGPLYLRWDAAWSIGRMRSHYLATGDLDPWAPVPSP